MKTLKAMYLEQQKSGGDSTAFHETSNEQKKKKKNPLMQSTRVWLANKLKGELVTVTEHDPDGPPSMLRN